MYNTSADYKTAIRSNDRPYDAVEGVIEFATDNEDLIVNGSNMPTNAITISKQCIDGDELMFGGVFASTLKLSIITDLDRYAFFGATITLNYKIQIGTENDEPVYETIPLGVFTVADAQRPNKIVQLTAYDKMTLLDSGIGGNLLSGTIWEVFQRIELDTTYDLAFTEADINALPNHEYPVSVSADQGINTYRDVVKVLCQLLGCFALDDRTGKLALKRFSTTPNLILGNSTTGVYPWYTLVPADYVSNYIGLSVTGMSGTYQAMSSDPTEQGLIMNIEDAPAWDMGSTESLQERTSELFTYLHSIVYTPCELDMPSDASFDCGDMLTLNLRDGTSINTIITSYEWKFHQGMSITSEGANPYLVEALVDPTSQRILNQAVAKSRLQFVHFTNPKIVNVGSTTPVLVASAEFTPTTETDALFVATILVNATVADITVTSTEEVEVPVKAYDGTTETTITDIHGNPVSLKGIATNTNTYKRDGKCDVSIFYKLNGITLPNDTYPYIAIDEIENGEHIITVSYPLTALTPWQRFEFDVYMTVSGGSVQLPANTLKATIFGQEIDVVNRFGGVIKIDEEILLTNLVGLGAVTMGDTLTISTTNAIINTVSDNILLYNISSLTGINLYEGTGELSPHVYLEGGARINTESGDYLSTEDGDNLITE